VSELDNQKEEQKVKKNPIIKGYELYKTHINNISLFIMLNVHWLKLLKDQIWAADILE
jgi:hypothetical protein